MSQSSSKSLQFSINETIWLKDGEAAEEILSMALEPDITIEENRSYVSIKGGLRLTGEYKPAEDKGLANQPDPTTFRTIDEITESDSGTSLIEHRFPVDITIPSERIHDLEDVFVMIETFDYSMPEKNCIQLEADISITGLIEENSFPAYGDDNNNDSENAVNHPYLADKSLESEQTDDFHPDSNEIPFQQSFQFEASRDVDNKPDQQESPQIEMKKREEDHKKQSTSFREDKDQFSPFNHYSLSNQDFGDHDEKSINQISQDDILPLRPIFPNIDKIPEQDEVQTNTDSQYQYNYNQMKKDTDIEWEHQEALRQNYNETSDDESLELYDNQHGVEQDQVNNDRDNIDEAAQKVQYENFDISNEEDETTEYNEDLSYSKRENESSSYNGEDHDSIEETEDESNYQENQNHAESDKGRFEKKIKVVPKENKNVNKKENKKETKEENKKENKEVEKQNKKLEKSEEKAVKKENKQKYKENKKEKKEIENQENVNKEAENEEKGYESENEPKKKMSKREENALYLTSMLTNENEQFSKVKMCIVQSGDSIESISERYQVPVTSILRKNNLESDFVDEGQVLYIPIPKKR
ncbi:LysM peptidoglycan-binding domain-containing protein [Scopulibacillus cellulosilyticus]|uniref:LysM peptidoglycan-binding domain-containing protein n=1 Tax=Scopulibacillus cellulosilyticus TaxID=2665665 RepID=A0ABW2Q140_9BACL